MMLVFEYLGLGKRFRWGEVLFDVGFLGVSMVGGILGVNLKGRR